MTVPYLESPALPLRSSAVRSRAGWYVSSGAIKTHRFLTLKNNHIENRSGLEARKEEVWGWPQGWGNHAGTKESGPAHPEVASASLGNLDPPSAFQSRLFSVTRS